MRRIEQEPWRTLAKLKAGKFGEAKPATPIIPLPRSEWPMIVKLVADQSQSGERGVGDTLRNMDPEFSERFKSKFKAAGIDCGCAGRIAWFNQRFPYV